MVYYIRGDKEFQGEPERVYGANWAKTGSKWAYNHHIREGRGQIDQKSANTVGYDPEDGVQRAPNLRILLLLPRIDFPVCLYFFCNMPSDCALLSKSGSTENIYSEYGLNPKREFSAIPTRS